MRLDLAKGARLTVKENDRIGPRFVRWHSSFEELSSRAVSSTTLSARTATDLGKKIGRWRHQPRARKWHLAGLHQQHWCHTKIVRKIVWATRNFAMPMRTRARASWALARKLKK